MTKTLLALTLLCAAATLAADPPKLKGKMKKDAPKLDLGMPTFNEIPKGQGLQKPKDQAQPEQTRSSPDGPAPYSVVRVVNGKSFVRTAQGAKASAPFPGVLVSGDPLMSEKFGSVIRVKSPSKRSGSIEVSIADARGDTVMEASGAIQFGTAEEAEWTVDWEPTGIRRAGDLQMTVKVAGQVLGTFPLKVVSERDKAAPPATADGGVEAK